MKRIEAVEYVAFDGMVFKDPIICEKYEEQQKLRNDAERRLVCAAEKIIKILNDNEMHLEFSEDDVTICFDEHFKELHVSLT